MANPVQSHTVPTTARAAAAMPAVKSGSATDYWLELAAYPPGTARSLWLKVDNKWVHQDDPSETVERAVTMAFAHSDKFEVLVWHSGDNIVGLVAKSK